MSVIDFPMIVDIISLITKIFEVYRGFLYFLCDYNNNLHNSRVRREVSDARLSDFVCQTKS